MIFRHEQNGAFWIDIEQPTPEEVHAISKEFSIGSRIETELLSPSPLPLVAGDAEHALLVLHFPAHGTDDGQTASQEIDFVVGQKFILTVRYEVIAPLHHLRKLLEANGLVGTHFEMREDMFLEILFAHLFATMRDHTNHIANRLLHIEKGMFGGHERDTVLHISEINREFLHLQAAVANHEEPLTRFLQALERRNFFGPAFGERAQRIRGENEQLARLIGTHRAVGTELRATNMALLSARQNEVMKTLTVMTFLVLPLNLIAFIFAMHVPGTPLMTNPNAFWIILTAMLGVVGILVLYFAKKRWIF